MALSNKNYANYGATSLDPEVVVVPAGSKDISNICSNISTNIDSINSSIRFFVTVKEQIGTQKDTQGLRDQVLVRIMSTNQLVKTSQKDISKLTNLARSASKQQKLQIQKLTGHFKDIVERNYETQQELLDKLRTNTVWTPDSMAEFSGDGNGLLQSDQNQIQKNLEFEHELLLERQERIKQIETQILDANQLMRELSALINDQGTIVDTIESQIENVNENVQLANEELITAANYQTKARKKKLFLLGIVAIILIILVSILIWSST